MSDAREFEKALEDALALASDNKNSVNSMNEEEEDSDLASSVKSMDSEAFFQEQLHAAEEDKKAEIAAMSPEELFYSRHGIPALAAKAEQDKLDEEQFELEEQLREELKKEQIEQIRNINASREADLAHRKKEMEEEIKPSLKRSGIEKNRQSFARQAFDNRSNPRHDDEFGGGKKRTIRKKNRKGTRTTIRKRQRKNRTRTMRKKARKSRKSRKSNKAR